MNTHKLKNDTIVVFPFGKQCMGFSNENLTQDVIDLLIARGDQDAQLLVENKTNKESKS